MDEKSLIATAEALHDLHLAWLPHQTQAQVAHAVFYRKCKKIFLENGRKWGKSEILIYILWRWCIFNPGSAVYFIAPFQKQAREIIWANQRIQNFLSNKYKYLSGRPNNTEMRVTFKNGSFIKLDGSDNYEAYRGITPHLIIYDEFKDFRPEFHVAMEPNLAAKNAPIIFAGTPPETDNNQYCIIADECKADKDAAYFNFPSWTNPHLDREWLAKKKRELYARGEGDVWEREYGARRVKGGINSIFPMFNRNTHSVSHETIMAEIERDRHKLIWMVLADPGNVTCFGVLFCAYNPYTCKLYVLDEIYEKEQKQTSTSCIVPRIREIREELYREHDEWHQTYDEAATWFATEALASFNEAFFPTSKSQHKKDEGLSLIKDQLLKGLIVVSERCEKLMWEMENYVRDKNGKVPKENDHLIDCLRYANATAGVTFIPDNEPPKKDPIDDWRAKRIEDDLYEDRGIENSLDPFMDYGVD